MGRKPTAYGLSTLGHGYGGLSTRRAGHARLSRAATVWRLWPGYTYFARSGTYAVVATSDRILKAWPAGTTRPIEIARQIEWAKSLDNVAVLAGVREGTAIFFFRNG